MKAPHITTKALNYLMQSYGKVFQDETLIRNRFVGHSTSIMMD